MIKLGTYAHGNPAVASAFRMPLDLITQAVAVIGRRGSGKTYTATVLLEQLLANHGQVIAVDPVGNMHGLQVDADGKRPSQLPVVVFGGEHANVPLSETQGERLAHLIVERNLSAVVDVSGFLKAQRKRFMADFAEKLFHLAKTHRRARMFVLEEAQLFAPQHSAPGEERMLGAITDIVRLGRNYGLGSMLITQRPQSVSKEVLNQSELLILHQLVGPHERKAIEAWVVEHDDATKAARGWLQHLPSLPTGEAMVWSPSWLKVFERVKVAAKTTWDTSSTPLIGAASVGQASALPRVDVDVSALAAALQEPAAAPAKPERASKADPTPPAVDDERAERTEAALEAAQRECERLRRALDDMHADFDRVAMLLGDAQRVVGEKRAPVSELPPALPAYAHFAPFPRVKHAAVAPGSDLKAGALRMLTILATFYPGSMTRHQVARAADMKVTGGTFASYWSALTTQALIEQAGPKLYRASAAGLKRLGAARPEVPNTATGRIAFWKDRLKAGEVRMLDVVVSQRRITRAELARAVGMEAKGGTFASYLSTLMTNRLVAKDGSTLRPHSWLMTGYDT